MDTSNTTNTTNTTNNPINQLGTGSIGKEVEAGSLGLEQPTIKDVSGAEIELPKEVASAGVRVQPATVQLPQSVAQMGVTSVGQTTQSQATTVALPLTDDQIAQGLKLGITSSWRWLAQWCVRKIKQLHQKIMKN